MPKPIGGRGKKAPYRVQMVRVPIPIKPVVEKLIDDYRREVLETEAEKRQIPLSLEFQNEIDSAIKLVDRFTEYIGQSGHLDDPKRRNNVNLARFRQWLKQQIESQDAP